jgi:hypothetical protein
VTPSKLLPCGAPPLRFLKIDHQVSGKAQDCGVPRPFNRVGQ